MQLCTLTSHLELGQQGKEEEAVFTVEIVISNAHSGQIDPSCPDAY